MKRQRELLLSTILCGLFLISTTLMAQSTEKPAAQIKTEFDSFSALRSEILSKIGSASKRVWIVSDFLTDAELVSSLYIAQYRKVEVQVLLGRAKAANILSRLNYLKQVHIPVALRPRGFFAATPSLILIDDQLFAINSELDYLSKSRPFRMTQIRDEDVARFEAGALEAAKNPDVPVAKALPLVGQARYGKGSYKKNQKNDEGAPINTVQQEGESAAEETTSDDSKGRTVPGSLNKDGAYRYRSVRNQPDKGVPTKLPKMTLSQELERQRAASEKKTPSTPTDSQ